MSDNKKTSGPVGSPVECEAGRLVPERAILEAWKAGRPVQYLVMGGYDDDWTDYMGVTPPDTQSQRLAWRELPSVILPAHSAP